MKNSMKLAVLLFLVAGTSQAANIKLANYKSTNCNVNVFAGSDGATAINLITKDGGQVDQMVIEKDNKLSNGPSLCTDADTVGKTAAANVVAKQVSLANGQTAIRISCGGALSQVDVQVEMITAADGTLLSLREREGRAYGAGGIFNTGVLKKYQVSDCLGLK